MEVTDRIRPLFDARHIPGALQLTATALQATWFFCDQLAGQARAAGHLDLARPLERQTRFLYEIISKLPERAADIFERAEVARAEAAVEKEALNEFLD